jgi:lipoyl(octanoyl) transferase
MIRVLHLGTVDYATALRLQEHLIVLRKEGSIGDVLLLLEHNPVITLGRNAKTGNVLVEPEQLAVKGVELFECDRGGDVTFHGPGQLVAYPIFDLHGLPSGDGKRRSMGAIEFVRRLEEVLIQVCNRFGISTGRISGLTGVWTFSDPKQQAKIAAIGVHISRGVTSHGFALNVNINLDYFRLIVPCGISSCPVTSIQKEIGRTVPMPEVEEAAIHAFGKVLQTDVMRLETLDDLLRVGLDIPLRVPVELRRLHKDEERSWA